MKAFLIDPPNVLADIFGIDTRICNDRPNPHGRKTRISWKWPFQAFRSSEKVGRRPLYMLCARGVLEWGRELGRDSVGF